MKGQYIQFFTKSKTMLKTSAYYLDFVNNFLTVAKFAEHYDLTVEQAQSIIVRSKIVWLSEDSANRKYFLNNNVNLCGHYRHMSESNKGFFCKRHEQNLLAECSA